MERALAQRYLGSPPRVRGKGRFPELALLYHGITPACAGKSNKRSIRPRYSWDHPRVCGEKSPQIKIQQKPAGSPPRVRGKARYMITGTG